MGGTREVSLLAAHLIFIDDPSDINILMKLARWPNYKLLPDKCTSSRCLHGRTGPA